MIKVKTSPNIAFIKYWGKKDFSKDEDRNIGLNPSISMTLSKAQTEVRCRIGQSNVFHINNQKASEKDYQKIVNHIQRVSDFYKVPSPKLHIDSSNNFPTGTGIASSASAYSALTLAIAGVILGEDKFRESYDNSVKDLAQLARRGSGSACRSLESPFVLWDEKETQSIDPEWPLYDTILIFSDTEKKVSSTEGHKYASSSPLFPKRLETLPHRSRKLLDALSEKDIHQLGAVLEEEADEMHNIMRSGTPSIEYQGEETKRFLDCLKKLNDRNFYYTLDAGPNVHIISEAPCKETLEKILKDLDLSPEVWEDKVGSGPVWEFSHED